MPNIDNIETRGRNLLNIDNLLQGAYGRLVKPDVKNLYRDAFGKDAPDNYSLEPLPTENQYSELGQPYYETDQWGREYFMPVKLGGVWLPLPVIGMRMSNNIVKTMLPFRKGTVKQEIGGGDWEITIRGIIIREDNNFPELEIRELVALAQRGSTLELRSALTDLVLHGESEHQVVIEDIDFPSVSGSKNYKPYEIKLLSDSVFTLIVEE